METLRLTLPLLLISLSFLFPLYDAQMNGNFKCNVTNTTCRSLIGYSTKNATTLHNIQTLFSINNLRLILEANNFPVNTTRDRRVNPNEIIRVPITCSCSNGTGVSNRLPVYTAKANDTLFFIASEIFGALVRYEKIAEVNNVPDPNDIEAGQEFWIPLPCSCDRLNGQDVVHYGHVVKLGSSLGEIASQFGTDNTTLAQLNGISGDAQLLADYPLNVPLRACNSYVRKDSLDAPLLLPNSSYLYTANDCVKCSCEASNNWTLSCEPSQLMPSLIWKTCKSTKCEAEDSFPIGNTTTSSCGSRSCNYAGFNNLTIFTTISPDTCPDSGGGRGTGNEASTFRSSFSCFAMVLIQFFFFVDGVDSVYSAFT